MIDFDGMIDNYLHRDNKPKEVGRYYPSEIGYCLRKVWFTYKQPKETEAELIRIFEAGNMLHGFVVDVLKSEKNPNVELVESEHPFRMETDGFCISGRIDDVIVVKSNNEKILVEVKTCKSVDFIDKPGPAHLMQLQLYMHATGIHRGILLYIEKNTLRSKTIDIEYDENKAKEAFERFKKLDDALKNDAPPNPEAKEKAEIEWMCRYCPYWEECSKV